MYLRYFACAIAIASLLIQSASAQFVFEKEDSLAIIGNALPDRMQHDGWLEAYLQTGNPGKNLQIRNLGFTGDEVAHRPRNQNFMTMDESLTLVEANVIFAFYGYNESFAKDPDTFKQELSAFIDHTLAQQYDGETVPRLVLFSPIAHENLESPNFPDGTANNLWLSVYTDAMARVAYEKGVPFFDLYAPTKALYEATDEPLTINGVHLNAAGNKAVAEIILEVLGQKRQEEAIELVRASVLDKNWCWFNRHRATDGNDVWGSRSTLEFVDKQTNFVVLQHELKMLDVMTANRDKVIWEAINGNTIEPDDSNVPDPVLVKTNYKPSEKNGALEFVPADKGVETLTLEEGMTANLFASEEMFPELVNPVQMDVDTQGRIWVAAWETYPKWQPDQEMLDRLLILEDNDSDGVADNAKTFAFVHNPTGFTFWNGGVVVASAPNIWHIKDTDGDDVADFREIIFSGIDSADTHHAANGFDYGPDGYIYYQRGVFHVSNVETPWQAPHLSGKTGMYRFNPRSHRFSFHADNSPNPHGGDFDYWGYHFATDATGGQPYQVRMDVDGKFKMHKLLEKTVRPVPSSGILSSEHFPDNDGNYIVLNSIGFLGIKQYTLDYKEDGSVWGTETDDLLVSSDGNFRPADFKVGIDGALYVSDWANPLIGHMQHNVRDPSRDHEHGRVYRITVDGQPLMEPVKIDGMPTKKILEALKHPTNGVRQRARVELSERKPFAVLSAVDTWIEQFDGTKEEDAHHLLEALWLYQQFDTVNEGLLTVLLNSPVRQARHAAERVKYMWEIEGKLGGEKAAMLESITHKRHSALAESQAHLKQDPTPDPRMDGDTMVVHIQTLIEQMRYDRKAFAVAPNMKVRIEFSNPDAMDHNLVITKPGAGTQVAMAATMLGTDGIAKQWLPESDKILVASNILQGGQKQTIEFTAPAKVGQYDYVCTYPGHAMLMNGVMHVVNDVAKWTEANKDNVLSVASHRAFVQEWKVSDLSDGLKKLDAGRDLKRGEAVFASAACAQCHVAVPGATGSIGPDLGGVAERLEPLAMLTEVIDPSAVINEDYKSWKIEIETEDAFDESTLIGLITEQTDDFIRVVTNPLQDTEGVKVERSKVKSMTAAPLSTMPNGVLNSYAEDEILDLLAYVRSLKAK